MTEIKKIITTRSLPEYIEENLLNRGLTVTETVDIEIPTEGTEGGRGMVIEVNLNDDETTINREVENHVKGIVNTRESKKFSAAKTIQARVRGNKLMRIAANAQRAKNMENDPALVETQNKGPKGQPSSPQLTRANSSPQLTRALSLTAGLAGAALDEAAAAKAGAVGGAKAASQGGTKRHTRKKK